MGSVTSVAIRQPTADGKNHTVVLKQLKEATETASRQRGDPSNSYVQVSELLATGMFKMVNNTLVLVPPTLRSKGWGQPANGQVINNFDASTATAAQVAEALAAVLAVMLQNGEIGV